MILELDVGNTRAKWRLSTGAGGIVARGSGSVDGWCIGEIPDEWPNEVGRIRVAWVRQGTLLSKMISVLLRRFGVRAEIAVVNKECCGVRVGYAEPDLLGVDRWSAMVAAFVDAGKSVLVADVGSALTLDLVDSLGVHRGGFIIPGPRLMRDVLTTATDRIRFDKQSLTATLEFGHDTAACVLNGAMLATVGAIQMAANDSVRLLGYAPQLYLTGGHAQELSGLTMFAMAAYRPDLVLDGLSCLMP